MSSQQDNKAKPGDESRSNEKAAPPDSEAGVRALGVWSRAFEKQGVDIATASLLLMLFMPIVGLVRWFADLSRSGMASWQSLCVGASAEAMLAIVGICLGAVATLGIALLAGPSLASNESLRDPMVASVNRVATMKWMQGIGVAAALLAATANGVSFIFLMSNVVARDDTDGCYAPIMVFPTVVIAVVTTLLSWRAIRPDLELAELSAELRAAEFESARSRIERIEARCHRGDTWRIAVVVLAIGAILVTFLATSAQWVEVDSPAGQGLTVAGLAVAWFVLSALILAPIAIYRWNKLSHGGPGLTRRTYTIIGIAGALGTSLYWLVVYWPMFSIVRVTVLVAMIAGTALAVFLCVTDRLPRLNLGSWVGRWLIARLNRQMVKLEESMNDLPPTAGITNGEVGTGEDP